jgi:cytochrome P450
VLVADPKIAHAVLMDPARFTSPGVYPRLGPAGCPHRRLREGIILAKGEAHADQRRRVLPSLAPAAVEAMRPQIAQICREETASWPSGQTVDVVPLIRRLLRRLSLEVLFRETDLDLGHEVGAALEQHAAMSLSLQAVLLPFDLPGLHYGRLMRQAERAEAVLARWVRERRRGPLQDDMLSRLLAEEASGVLSEADAAAQLWTLYGASFHTMSAALSWLLVLLAQHPDEAERVRASFADPARRDGGTPRAAHDAIQEALRLMSPVPFQLRQSAGDLTLPHADLRLQDRDTLVLSSLVINRGPAFGPDPLAFRPGRWRELGVAARSELLLFSDGPRTCPGGAFAFAVLGSALEAVWRAWRVRLAPRARLDYRTSITMSARRVPVTLSTQDGAFETARATGPAIRVSEALRGPLQRF